MGCQDKNFLLDGEKRLFPEVPAVVPYIVDLFLSGRHKTVWQFNPSTIYAQPHPIPAPVTGKMAKISTITPFVIPNNQSLVLPGIVGALIILILYFLLL
jgi:hypothetical protein